jgi:UDP-N-acetylglucosamine-lysosomal-enzyme
MEDSPDTFADSLRHVNRLYTQEYGHVTRKVPAHMPHYIQKDVMLALQEKFPEEFESTSSHPVSRGRGTSLPCE